MAADKKCYQQVINHVVLADDGAPHLFADFAGRGLKALDEVAGFVGADLIYCVSHSHFLPWFCS